MGSRLAILLAAGGACLVGCGSRTGLDFFGKAATDSGGLADATGGSSFGSSDSGSTRGIARGSLPPSCVNAGDGRTNCGSSNDDCCTSLEVTGGTFFRTYPNPGNNATGFTDSATVSTFRLDKYLVTVGRFRQFVNAWNNGKGYTPPAGSGKHTHLNGGKGLNATTGGYEPGWLAADDGDIAPTDGNLACNYSGNTWTSTASTQENLPINCANWWESYAFCIWDGGFLPSEAEWEYAAAGGSEQREFPWGSAMPGTACPGTGCQYAIYNCYYPNGSGMCSGPRTENIAAVGAAALGAGLWGHFDLVGEVYEWELDAYAPFAACTDCAYVDAAGNRVLRGGCFWDGLADLLPPYRGYSYPPRDRGSNMGFRCARPP